MMRNRPPQSPEDKKRKKKDEKVDPADFRSGQILCIFYMRRRWENSGWVA
jgi:hypothetical protein